MMRKNVWCLVLVLALMLALNACGHTHTGGDWQATATTHCKICECGQTYESGEHTLDDLSRCTVCGAEVTDWGDSVDVTCYDEQGNPVRYLSFDSSDNLITELRIDYTYDSEGNVTSELHYENDVLLEECAYEDGILVSIISYNDDGTYHISLYDDEGNLTSNVCYNAEGQSNGGTYSEYAKDGDGNWYEVRATTVDVDGSKYVGEYNERGDQIAWITYDPDGNMEHNERYEITYTKEGEKDTVKTYSNDVLVEERIYTMVTYDDGWMNYPGTIIEYHEDGTKTVSEYAENDELISQTHYDTAGNAIE